MARLPEARIDFSMSSMHPSEDHPRNMRASHDPDDDYVFISAADFEFDQVNRSTSQLFQSEYIKDIGSYIDSLTDALWPVNKTIHDNPELAYKEKVAHATLTNFLGKQNGWKVIPSAYGMATAFVAIFESGKNGPVVSFNAEMDALPKIGHACGHNLIATASLAGALATGHIIKRYGLTGKVVLFGTPAEEGGGGKIRLLEAGAYKDYNVDISLISHPGSASDTALMRSSAFVEFKIEYFGQEAHAAASPWLGINALDALITAYNALSVLRQQTMPGDIIQGHITDGGLVPNIIHAYASGVFVVRANTRERLQVLREKVNKCFEGGAVATGARLEITEIISYDDHVPNRVLGSSYRKHFNSLGGSIPPPMIDEIQGRTMASTDQGNISHAMPSLNAGFWIQPGKKGTGPHSPEFREMSGTREAFELSLRVGKGLAGTAVDALTNKPFLKEVKEEFDRGARQG